MASVWSRGDEMSESEIAGAGEDIQLDRNRLPLFSPYDIAIEDSWELVFPEWHLHLPLLEAKETP